MGDRVSFCGVAIHRYQERRDWSTCLPLGVAFRCREIRGWHILDLRQHPRAWPSTDPVSTDARCRFCWRNGTFFGGVWVVLVFRTHGSSGDGCHELCLYLGVGRVVAHMAFHGFSMAFHRLCVVGYPTGFACADRWGGTRGRRGSGIDPLCFRSLEAAAAAYCCRGTVACRVGNL